MGGLSSVWVLAAHNLRGRWRSLIIWGVALGALGALYVALYPTMSNILEQYLEEAPETMRGFMGEFEGSISAAQWLEIEFFSALLPIALPFLVIVLGARTVAGSEERKTLDLLLSNPVPRWQVIGGALLTMGVSLAAVLVLTWILTYIAVPASGVELSGAAFAAALAGLWPFCMLFGALSLLMSALLRRNVLAIIVPGVLLVAMYVIGSLAQATDAIRPLRHVSLIYHLGHPLQGDFPWVATIGMVAGTCVLALAAVAAFRRRDVFT